MNIFAHIKKYCVFSILALLCMLPIFFVTVTENMFETSKWMLLAGITCLTCIVFSLKAALKNTLSFSWSLSTCAFGLLSVAAFMSLAIVSEDKLKSLTNPYGLGTLLSCFLLMLLLPPFLTKKHYRFFRHCLEFISGFIGLCVLYQGIGIGSYFFPNNMYLKSPLFSPLGSPSATIAFFLFTIPLIVDSLMHAKKNYNDKSIVYYSLSLLLAFCAVGVTIWRYIPMMSPSRLPIGIGAELVVKSFQTAKTLFFGVGSDGFLSAFTLFRPVSLNVTPLWSIGFITNATLFFHIASTLGLCGIFALGLYLFAKIKHATTRLETIHTSILIIIVLFFPPAFIFFPFFVFSTLLFPKDEHTYSFELPWLISIPTALVAGIIIFLSGIGIVLWYEGELLYHQSMNTRKQGNGTKTYQYLQKAVMKRPTDAMFRTQRATVCLSLATSIINNAPTDANGKMTLSKDDEDMAKQLITAAVKDIKLAVTLSPNDVMVWSQMAALYQSLIGSATGAETWAIAAYKKAITLDPTNPILHVNLGGVYVVLKQYDSAHEEFLTAVTLKPNYANAYYNMADMFIKKNDFGNAKKALENTRDLLPPNSEEYQKVQMEIDALK